MRHSARSALAPSRAISCRIGSHTSQSFKLLPGRVGETPGTACAARLHPAGLSAGKSPQGAGPQSKPGRPHTASCRSPLEAHKRQGKQSVRAESMVMYDLLLQLLYLHSMKGNDKFRAKEQREYVRRGDGCTWCR